VWPPLGAAVSHAALVFCLRFGRSQRCGQDEGAGRRGGMGARVCTSCRWGCLLACI